MKKLVNSVDADTKIVIIENVDKAYKLLILKSGSVSNVRCLFIYQSMYYFTLPFYLVDKYYSCSYTIYYDSS